jgi:hypothetical protein
MARVNRVTPFQFKALFGSSCGLAFLAKTGLSLPGGLRETVFPRESRSDLGFGEHWIYCEKRDELWHAGDFGPVEVLDRLETFKPLFGKI